MQREGEPHPLASNETDYCVRYETGGRLLADRVCSRMLHDDWPRGFAELSRRTGSGDDAAAGFSA